MACSPQNIGKTSEKSKYKQEKNVAGVWKPAVEFGGSFRAEPLEPNWKEIRANIGYKLDKYIPVKIMKQPWCSLG